VAEALTAAEADPGEPVAEPPSAPDDVGDRRVDKLAEREPQAHHVFRRPEEDHSHRFRLAFLALAVILGAAVAGLVVLLAKPGNESGVAGWSEWSPGGGSDVERSQAIADYVAVNYRLADGKQLVTVQAEAPEVQSIPVDFIAIQSAPGGTVYSGSEIPVFRDAESKGIQYLLCGLGESCAISTGEPSVERQRLLRREALELALYTFQYVDGRDYVVVFMPPRQGDPPTYALFFKRDDLSNELAVPLRQTLPDPLPPLPDEISAGESTVIDRLTDPHFFAFRYSQLQNQQVVLVLNDPSVAQQQQQQSGQTTTGQTTTDQTTTTAPETTTGQTSTTG
jgi:hypothetical protein